MNQHKVGMDTIIGSTQKAVKEMKYIQAPSDKMCIGGSEKSVPLRTSPSVTNLVPPVNKTSKYLQMYDLHQTDEYETALDSSIKPIENLEIPNASAIITSTSSNYNNVPEINMQNHECPHQKYLNQASEIKHSKFTGIEETLAHSDLQHFKKSYIGAQSDYECSDVFKLRDSENQQDQHNNHEGPLNSGETSAMRSLSIPENNSARKKKKGKHETCNMLTKSSLGYAEQKHRRERRKKKLNSPCCAQDSKISVKHLIAGSLKDLQERRISDSHPFSRKACRHGMHSRNRSHHEPRSSSKRRRHSSSPHKRKAQLYAPNVSSSWSDNGVHVEQFGRRKSYSTGSNYGESLCSYRNRSPKDIESHNLLDSRESRTRGQYSLRIGLPPRSKSISRSCKLHRHDGHRAYHHTANKEQLCLVKIEDKGRRARLSDITYRQPLTLFYGKSDTDISNAILRERKNINLALRPTSDLTLSQTTSQIDFQTHLKKQKLGYLDRNRENISFDLQNQFLFENDSGYRDKVNNIKRWLEATGLSRKGSENQGSESAYQERFDSKPERSSVPIVMKLCHEKSLSPEQPFQDHAINMSPPMQDYRRSSLWLRESTPSPNLSSPEYFKLFKSAARGSLLPPAPPDSTTVDYNLPCEIKKKSQPNLDKGNPKKAAAKTAVGHVPSSRRNSKNQDLGEFGFFFGARSFGASCILYICLLIVALEVGAIVLLTRGKMLPASKIVESWLNQIVDELSLNITHVNSSDQHEDL